MIETRTRQDGSDRQYDSDIPREQARLMSTPNAGQRSGDVQSHSQVPGGPCRIVFASSRSSSTSEAARLALWKYTASSSSSLNDHVAPLDDNVTHEFLGGIRADTTCAVRGGGRHCEF